MQAPAPSTPAPPGFATVERIRDYTITPNAVLRDTRIKGCTRVVYFVLCSLASAGKNECWPTIQTIAERANCCRATVQTALKKLEATGWVRVERTWNHSSKYTVTRDFEKKEVRVPLPEAPEKKLGTSAQYLAPNITNLPIPEPNPSKSGLVPQALEALDLKGEEFVEEPQKPRPTTTGKKFVETLSPRLVEALREASVYPSRIRKDVRERKYSEAYVLYALNFCQRKGFNSRVTHHDITNLFHVSEFNAWLKAEKDRQIKAPRTGEGSVKAAMGELLPSYAPTPDPTLKAVRVSVPHEQLKRHFEQRFTDSNLSGYLELQDIHTLKAFADWFVKRWGKQKGVKVGKDEEGKLVLVNI